MPDISTFEKLRIYGRAETFSTSRHHLGFFQNVSFAATYTNPDAGPKVPLEALIHRALRTVIARHAMLSAITVNEDESYPEAYFARLHSINLKTCVEFVERKKNLKDDGRDEELDQVLQEQHSRSFKEDLGTKPLWRLVVLHTPEDTTQFTAIWVFHHALADGSSALVFHRTLLAALRSVSTEQHATLDDHIVESPSTPLIPALEDLHPLSISPLFLIKVLLGSIFPTHFNPRPGKLWTGNPVSRDSVGSTCKVRSLVLPSATTKRLLELSRQNKTTMQATLQCLLASATLANLDEKKYERVRISGPISLKPFLRWEEGGPRSLDEELVNGVSEYTYTHSVTSDPDSLSNFSWSSARAVRATIQTELDRKGYNSAIGLLRYVSNMHDFFTEKVGKERENSLELSNMGVWRDSREIEEGWKVGRCVFSQSPNITGAAIPVSVVTGGDGCAVLVFTWLEDTVENVFVERIVRSVEDEVRGILGAERV